MFIKDIRVEEMNKNIDWLVFERHNFGQLQWRKDMRFWDNTQKSRYIESLLTIGSISPFVIGTPVSLDYCHIVDGFHRFRALLEFIRDNEFCLFNLKYLKEFEGKKFSDLPKSIQRRIEMIGIKVYVIMPETLPEYYMDVCRTINPNIA